MSIQMLSLQFNTLEWNFNLYDSWGYSGWHKTILFAVKLRLCIILRKYEVFFFLFLSNTANCFQGTGCQFDSESLCSCWTMLRIRMIIEWHWFLDCQMNSLTAFTGIVWIFYAGNVDLYWTRGVVLSSIGYKIIWIRNLEIIDGSMLLHIYI